jgi:hypothetical protein
VESKQRDYTNKNWRILRIKKKKKNIKSKSRGGEGRRHDRQSNGHCCCTALHCSVKEEETKMVPPYSGGAGKS